MLLPWLSISAALALSPRSPLPPMPLQVHALPDRAPMGWALTVKIKDEVRGRATPSGGLRSEAGVDLRELEDLARAEGLRFRPLIALDPSRLAALEARARQGSGRAAADLGGMLRVEGPTEPAALLRIGQALQASPLVEYAWVKVVGASPPEDIGSVTPDYSGAQGYLDVDPGVDAWGAWELGVHGALVRVSDVEYGWELGHEDLVDQDLVPEPGQVVPSWVRSYGWDQHGTAVLGEILSGDNGYGTTGGAYGAQAGLYPEYTDEVGSRRAEAILSAAADSLPGDVIILEMQAVARSGGGYVPAETDPDVFTAVQTATDAGIVVVAAAGNGNEDLDGSWYVANYLAWGDSGAILVGAGSADLAHDRLSYSTFGSRVNLQGWGEDVTTLGYGDLATIDGDTDQRYTRAFSGTSSATPIVTLTAALVQDHALQRWSAPLEPLQLRELLEATGRPQGAGGHIGPLPDATGAMAALDDDEDGFLDEDWGGDDCEDTQADAHPGAEETWYDGVDGDCLGGDDDDADQDGYAAQAAGGEDCDDGDAEVNPEGVEVPGNGVDEDCDPSTGENGDGGSGDGGSGDGGSGDGGTGDGGSGDGGSGDGGGDDDDDDAQGCCAGGKGGAWLLGAPLLFLRRRRGRPSPPPRRRG